MADVTNYTFIAAETFLDETHRTPIDIAKNDRDDIVCASNKIKGHNVVIAVSLSGEYKPDSAAVVAQGTLSRFPNIRIGLLVGVGGGSRYSRHGIQLGDVVVGSHGVFQFGLRKSLQGEDSSLEQPVSLNQPPVAIRSAVSILDLEYKQDDYRLHWKIKRALGGWPYLQDYARPPSHRTTGDDHHSALPREQAHLVKLAERDSSKIHHGRIASSNRIMNNATAGAFPGDLCFETEAAGLTDRFPCLLLRGICDYSDASKHKGWERFAAVAAAAYAADLLRSIKPQTIETEKPILGILGQSQYISPSSNGTI
ncbi:nucleoside phosphorylase domain-containing protein [Colletotrichum godetiae]|uniref:Nucleoside phosphorylase domain-containing protein n=1 Tax=Colletotrichum godetiae TaxID=1209918 RepID=A0AAJ0ARG6_9PEZI|nr:nucleoside phosphorylase domain-containing protein [Colletotrichum godetiae]KAK1687586.1 nucleoside phosphorylase domain-containing protein [Colletotrichum godetiae]